MIGAFGEMGVIEHATAQVILTFPVLSRCKTRQGRSIFVL
jgi:hypothetical protein